MNEPKDIFPDINPAFCSLIIANFCQKYQDESAVGADFLTLLYVIPLVLSHDFDHFFKHKRKESDFFKLVGENPDVAMHIYDRIKGTIKITQQALSFALYKGICIYTEEKFVATPVLHEICGKKIGVYVKKYLRKSDLLGCWLGRLNSSDLLLQYMGEWQK